MTVLKHEFRRYARMPGGYAPPSREAVEVGTVAGAATVREHMFGRNCRG